MWLCAQQTQEGGAPALSIQEGFRCFPPCLEEQERDVIPRPAMAGLSAFTGRQLRGRGATPKSSAERKKLKSRERERLGKREKSSPAILDHREEQTKAGPGLPPSLLLPSPPQGTLPCLSSDHGHAARPLPLWVAPPPSFCPSLSKIAVLCCKVGTRTPGPGTGQEGLLYGGPARERLG